MPTLGQATEKCWGHFSRSQGRCWWPAASCNPHLRVGLGVLCTLSLSSISGPLSLLLHSSRLS